MYQKWVHMSRTLKDRPYWVKLNESTKTDHDHLHFGRTYTKTKPVLDKDGNEIFDDAEWGFTAKEIRDAHSSEVVEGMPWRINSLAWHRFFGWNKEHPALTNRQVNLARALYVQGRGDTFIVCGTYKKRREVEVILSQVANYCTAGEKYTNRSQYRDHGKREMPCTPSWEGLSEAAGKGIYTSDMADKKTTTRKEINGIIRRTERDTLNGVKNAWNSGYDVDDYDQDVDFTTSQPHKWAYWLY
jgi:hypothetical protein